MITKPPPRPPKGQTVKPVKQSDFAVTIECPRCGDLHAYPFANLNMTKPKPGDWRKAYCAQNSARPRPPHAARAILRLGTDNPFYIIF